MIERSQGEESKLKPKIQVFIVFGPSQFGKSTFINNLLKASGSTAELAEVGIGNGESVTIKAKTYNIGLTLFPQDKVGFDYLQLIDVPGFFDSCLRISKEEIFDEIKNTLLKNNSQKLDGILIFESMKSDARKVNHSMQNAMELFGEEIRNSVIVLSTKWDIFDVDETEVIENFLLSMIKRLGVAHMKWQNNFGTKKILTEEQMKFQLSELGNRLQKLSPYYVDQMGELIFKAQSISRSYQTNLSR